MTEIEEMHRCANPRCASWGCAKHDKETTIMSLPTEEVIARVCHEVNRAACAAFGDYSQPTWDDAPDWQRESAVTGVQFTLANPEAPPSASHECWLAEKERAGWTYGPVKDPEAKTHPCFVPYDELPPEQKLKDYLFQAVVRSMAANQPIQVDADPMLSFLAAVRTARSYLDAQDMDPRSRAVAITKLDEARLWASDGARPKAA